MSETDAQRRERERTEDGRYVETITRADIREAVASADEPVVTAREVAEVLGCSREAAYQKLSQLTEDGQIGKKKVGGRAVVWWLADASGEGDEDGEMA